VNEEERKKRGRYALKRIKERSVREGVVVEVLGGNVLRTRKGNVFCER
jgi:hypothetical protein